MGNIGKAGGARGPQRSQQAQGADKAKADVQAKKTLFGKKVKMNPLKGLKSLAKGIANKLGLSSKSAIPTKGDAGVKQSTEDFWSEHANKRLPMTPDEIKSSMALASQFMARAVENKAASALKEKALQASQQKEAAAAKEKVDAAKAKEKAEKEAKTKEAQEVFNREVRAAQERMGLGPVDKTKAQRDMEVDEGSDWHAGNPDIPEPSDD